MKATWTWEPYHESPEQYRARLAYNATRANLREHGIPDPEHDFTGAAGRAFQTHCLQGIHLRKPGTDECEICGDLLLNARPLI